MGFKPSAAIAALAILVAAPSALAANWQPIGNGTGKITIDRGRVGNGGDGLVAVWSRLDMPRAMNDAEGRYNTVEALNRYDCAGNRFATLKRLYLLDNALVRAEPVLAPKEVDIVAGSAEAAVLAEVCKLAAQKPQVAATAPPSASGGFMYADVVKLATADAPRLMAVADTGAAPKPATDAAPARRFIALPRIDPSQVQHPTDEPKAAEPAKPVDPAALKREAARAGVALDSLANGVDRRTREMQLATSGPRRKPAAPRVQTREEAPPEVRHKDIHWSYEGEGAPENWGRLRADYGVCESGRRQSPIDIRDGIRVDQEAIKFDYRPSQFRIVDNGHTVQVNLGEGNSIAVMGRSYRLLQLHFHRPSEERIDGRGFDMVMHLVHKDEEGRLAVLAVLLERGAEHPLIQTFWNNLPLETDVELAPASAIDPNKLLPEARTYYAYMGSLTTPPCSEGVLWLVMKQPLQVSAEQIAIFSRLYKNNARPIQPTRGRLIKESR